MTDPVEKPAAPEPKKPVGASIAEMGKKVKRAHSAPFMGVRAYCWCGRVH